MMLECIVPAEDEHEDEESGCNPEDRIATESQGRSLPPFLGEGREGAQWCGAVCGRAGSRHARLTDYQGCRPSAGYEVSRRTMDNGGAAWHAGCGALAQNRLRGLPGWSRKDPKTIKFPMREVLTDRAKRGRLLRDAPFSGLEERLNEH